MAHIWSLSLCSAVALFTDFVDPTSQIQFSVDNVGNDIVITSHTAMFGAHPEELTPAGSTPHFGHGKGVELVCNKSHNHSCSQYQQPYKSEGILMYRHVCTFLDKLQRASVAGASGVIVISDKVVAISPTAWEDKIE